MTGWVYVKSEPGLWTVGFFDPTGAWVGVSDHGSSEDAAERVHFLNGGNANVWRSGQLPPAPEESHVG